MFKFYLKLKTLNFTQSLKYFCEQKVRFSQFFYYNEKTNGKYTASNRRESLTIIQGGQCNLAAGYIQVRARSEALPTVKNQLLRPITNAAQTSGNKITIIGAGRVGISCAICILCQKISTEICIIDINEDKACSEMLDIMHASCFVHDATITGGTDFSLTKHSRMYIITLGVPAVDCDNAQLHLLNKKAAILKTYIPQIVLTCPHSIILMVTSPVDVLTHLAWKWSGFPTRQVLGTGTAVDSARFRYFISKALHIAPSVCNAYIIGKHGNSSVPVWSAVSVAGCRLRDLDAQIGFKDDGEGWDVMHENVLNAVEKVKKGKQITNWCVGMSVAHIAKAILKNTGAVLPVSTHAKGMYGIQEDVFLSLPCSLRANGVSNVIVLDLTPYEEECLRASARVIAELQSGVKT